MRIAIDFDGTCVRNEFPQVGAAIPFAVDSLRALVDAGHELTLFTMRSGKFLDDAVNWFQDNGISLEGIQYEKSQTSWTSSNKCFANLYIDDAALGAPLIHPEDGSRAYYDWPTAMFHFDNLKGNQNPVLALGEVK